MGPERQETRGSEYPCFNPFFWGGLGLQYMFWGFRVFILFWGGLGLSSIFWAGFRASGLGFRVSGLKFRVLIQFLGV